MKIIKKSFPDKNVKILWKISLVKKRNTRLYCRIYFTNNDNKNNIWNVIKAMIGEKFIAVTTYITKN